MSDPSNHSAKPDAKLKPCPDTPNCVSSLATDSDHRVDPILFADPPVVEMRRLEKLVGGMPGATIVEATEHYLHAEFRTKVFRFVDDVEFQWDASERLCHVRSASRTGSYDFGKNRERVKEIRRLFLISKDEATHSTGSD
jgi:uncharacterized protein (DUF1499 family)